MPKFLVTRLIFWADSMTVCPQLILIHPRVANDQGLRAHELVHVAQMGRDGWLRFVWRYAASKTWRQAYEVEAYRTSLQYDGSAEHFANLLATDYGLDISVAEAKHLLDTGGQL